MDQIERIRLMEERMNQVAAAAEALRSALDGFEAVRPQLQALTAYYESPQWLQDLAADSEGRLPDSLLRGVLSEDGLWDLLSETDALSARLR